MSNPNKDIWSAPYFRALTALAWERQDYGSVCHQMSEYNRKLGGEING